MLPSIGGMRLLIGGQCHAVLLTSSVASEARFSRRYTVSSGPGLIAITYLGTGSIHEEIERILRRIEHWHQGSTKSFRILFQDSAGLGGEVKWDAENG
jgi:hypothetical protein